MKKLLPLTVVLLFSIFVQTAYTQNNACPLTNQEAEQDLRGYLESEETITDLTEGHELTLTDTSYKKIQALTGEMDKEVCSSFIENAPWLENFEKYTFYKAEEYYFIMKYSISNGTYSRKGIDIFNKEFKRLLFVIDI